MVILSEFDKWLLPPFIEGNRAWLADYCLQVIYRNLWFCKSSNYSDQNESCNVKLILTVFLFIFITQNYLRQNLNKKHIYIFK